MYRVPEVVRSVNVYVCYSKFDLKIISLHFILEIAIVVVIILYGIHFSIQKKKRRVQSDSVFMQHVKGEKEFAGPHYFLKFSW